MISENQPILHESKNGYESFAFTIGKLPKTVDPFNSQEINTEAHIVTPTGKQWIIPCFYDPRLSKNNSWHLRFRPIETGIHTIVISALLHKNQKIFDETFQINFQLQSETKFQFFRIEDRGMRYPDGTLQKGIGINFSWEEEPGRKRGKLDYDYTTFLPRLKSMGVQLVRTWSCPWNLGFIWTPQHKANGHFQRYQPDRLRKIDQVFTTALEQEIHMMWCLDYHGALKEIQDYWGGNAFWPEHPYNVKNGGTCDRAETFFTDPAARQAYKDRLRYILARWGYSPALGIIEFWNEIDNSIDGDTHPIDMKYVIEWHKEMAAYLNELDAYRRPVSTSLSHTICKELYDIADLDFAQLHLYEQSEQLGQKLRDACSVYEKPTIVAEVGYDWRAPEAGQETLFKEDLKLAIWKSMFENTPILPMAWWWELYNENNGLPILREAAQFAEIVQKTCNWEVETIGLLDNISIESRGLFSEETCWISIRVKPEGSIPDTITVPLPDNLSTMMIAPLSSIPSWENSAQVEPTPASQISLHPNLFSFPTQPNVSHYIFQFALEKSPTPKS